MAAKQTIVKTTTRRSAVKVPKSTGKRGSNKCPVCGKFMSTKKG